MRKPLVYVASPYTQGDPALNTHFQCRVFDRLLDDGLVWPIVPLWTHFQHTVLPRRYEDWLEYDTAILGRCDACLRLDAVVPEVDYVERRSSGADAEVDFCAKEGKPVFFCVEDLYDWVRTLEDDAA